MPWLFPAVIASLCTSLALVLVFSFLYFQYRERHVGIWALGWSFYALRYIFLLLVLNGVSPHDMRDFIQLCVLAGGLMLLWGSTLFVGKRATRLWLACGGLGAGWVLFCHLTDTPFFIESLPIFLFFGFVSIWTGYLFLRSPAAQGPGKYLAGGSLILWGLHQFDYPFLRTMEGFAPWGYLIGGTLGFIVAMGILLVYFQRVRQELLDREKTLLSSREHYRALVETIPHGVLESDGRGRITFANACYARMHGVEPEHLIGRFLWEMIKPSEERESLRRKIDTIRAEQPEPAGEIIRNQDLEGRTVFRQFDWDYLRDSQGKIEGFITVVTDITDWVRSEEDLRRANQALRQSEQKLRALLDHTFQFIGLLDPAGTLLQANQTALDAIGATDTEVIGRPFWDTPWWNHSTAEQEKVRQAIGEAAQGQFIRFETFHLYPDQTPVLIDFSLKPVRDENGQVIYLIPEARDITKLKQIENQLRAANNTLEALFEAAPLPAIALDAHDRVTLWNPAAEKLFGWSAGEVLGKPYPLVPRGEQDHHRLLLDRVWNGHNPQNQEVKRQKKDGTLLDISLSTSPLRDEHNHLVGAIGILVDITGQKRAEKQLIDSEQRFRKLSQEFQTLLDGIPDPIVHLSPEMKLIWHNKAAARAFIGHDQPFPDQHCHTLWHNRSEACSNCPVQKCFATGQVQGAKVQAPGGTFWGVKAFPQFDQSGRVTSVIKVASDITERIRLREEAERASRLASLGELSAGVAHEINNPNGLVLLNLPFLREVFGDVEPILEERFEQIGDFQLGGLRYTRVREEIPQVLSEIQDGATRIRRIVEDLKDFARQRADDPAETLDLNRALQTSVRLAANAIKNATDHFSIEYADDLPLVHGNSQRIEQVMVNLIMNACQALPDKSRAVSAVTAIDADGKKILLCVQDQGVGIAPENLPHLTDPFFTTRRESGGTGLGLSVSARIVKEHGGSLQFDSVPGQGTRAVLALPIPQEGKIR